MDPARTLALLWRQQQVPGRGPRPGLDVDTVVDAAVAAADRSGLEALTMRRLAADLGVAPMTLYTYVPGKAELLELVLDALYAGMARPNTAGQTWRARVRAVAEENRALHDAHPWVLPLLGGRPLLGPGETAKYEHELAALDDAGLDDVDRDAALTFVVDFVVASSRTRHRSARATAGTGATDEQWWAEQAPLLARVLDAAVYPRAVRIGTAAGAAQGSARDPDHAWRFGLARVLDGLGALVDGTRPADAER